MIPTIRALIHNRIATLSTCVLKPSSFCDRYVNLSPDEWGYRNACIEELHAATGISKKTIENWETKAKTFDNCPDYVLELLKKEHTIRQIKILLND